MASFLPPYSKKHIFILGSITLFASIILLLWVLQFSDSNTESTVASISAQELSQDQKLQDALTEIQQNRAASAWFDYGVQLIDIRPSTEFEKSHIKGADSTPLSDLDQATFPTNSVIIVYSPSSDDLNKARDILQNKNVGTIYLLSDDLSTLESQGYELAEGSPLLNHPYAQEMINQIEEKEAE